MPQSLSDEGAAFVAQQEGAVPFWYLDATSTWTLGIGHARIGDEFPDVQRRLADGTYTSGRRLTEAEMWDLFRTDAERYTEAVNRLVTTPLTQWQWDATFDFAFNWGIGEVSGFPATSVLRLINDEDFDALVVELVDGRGPPTKAHPNGRRYDKDLPGVRRRRQLEAAAFAVNGWMPDAIHTPPANRPGLDWKEGTAWKLLLHTTESSYRRNQGGRANYHGHQSYPHFEVSEAAIEQYLPITVGAYALAPSTDQWGVGNAAHAVQIEIVWAAANARNMSERLLANIARVLTFVRRETGMATNLPPQGFPERVSQANWFDKHQWYAFEGLAGHGNCPGNYDRWDPGPLPAERIVALSDAEMGGTPEPEPPPVPKEDDMSTAASLNILYDWGGGVFLLRPFGSPIILTSSENVVALLTAGCTAIGTVNDAFHVSAGGTTGPRGLAEYQLADSAGLLRPACA